MSAAYTPGPWFAVNAGTKQEPMMEVRAARIAGREPRHCVAICATGDSPQPMENANARLIAAAPELAATLAAVADFWAGGDAPVELENRIHAALRAAGVRS